VPRYIALVLCMPMLALVGIQLLIPWIITLLIARITDPGTTLANYKYVTTLTMIVLGAYVVRAGLTFVRSYLAHVAGWGVVADVREYIYEHMQRLSLRFYEDKQVGNLMSNVVNDTDLFEQFIAHAIPDVVVNLVTLIGVTAVLFFLNWKLTLLSLIPIPLVFLSLQVYAKYVRPAFRNRQKVLGDLNALLNDNLSGIREIKAFGQQRKLGEGVDQMVAAQVPWRDLGIAEADDDVDRGTCLGGQRRWRHQVDLVVSGEQQRGGGDQRRGAVLIEVHGEVALRDACRIGTERGRIGERSCIRRSVQKRVGGSRDTAGGGRNAEVGPEDCQDVVGSDDRQDGRRGLNIRGSAGDRRDDGIDADGENSRASRSG